MQRCSRYRKNDEWKVGEGLVRTGVTIVLPKGKTADSYNAGYFIDTEKVLRLTVEFQNGTYDYYMDEVNWSGVSKEEYHFLIPFQWIMRGQDITKDTEAKLLYFIKERKFRLLGSGTRYRYEVIDFKASFISIENWKKLGQKTIFRAKTNGEILQIEMSE